MIQNRRSESGDPVRARQCSWLRPSFLPHHSEGIPELPEQQFPEPTVGAVIFNTEDRFLLLKSHKFNGQYVVPGGHIELGETMEEALRREIMEETGLTVRDIELVDLQEFIYDEIYWKKRHFIFLDYRCRTDGTDVVLNEEAEEYLWATLDESRSLPVEPYTKHTLDACFGGESPILTKKPFGT
jgi:nucleoside triphosphatase